MSVVAKVFKTDSAFSLEEYRDEIEGLMQLHHPNILQIITCFEVPSPCVIMPLMALGDLCSYIKRTGALALPDAKAKALGIAKGMKFCNSKNPN
jgi:serine/threonine protein kinase